ncbi:MAG: DsrE/DsrF/DrsH-like family protein [Betaproteobacteria bacterium]|jgi:Uncharacterized conserved protein|nr:DsrE/DsrF/DrsH-like family protein [Betaproteobacteria bacterium]
MDKISVVMVSGSLERLQAAAMVASVAAVSGHEVLVFLSMNALPWFVKGTVEQPPVEGMVGSLMQQKNVPGFKMLFEQAVDLGNARIYPCSMAMDVLDLEPPQLEGFLGEPTGLTKFLSEIQGSQIFTF